MKISIKYVLIILIFLLICQQGFWESLDDFGDFSVRSEILTQSVKDTFWSMKKNIIAQQFDLPHTQIKVNWPETN